MKVPRHSVPRSVAPIESTSGKEKTYLCSNPNGDKAHSHKFVCWKYIPSEIMQTEVLKIGEIGEC